MIVSFSKMEISFNVLWVAALKVYNRSDNLSSHLQIAHGVKLIKKDKGGSLALHVMSNSFMQHV